MSDVKTPVRSAPAYDDDFYAWSQDQAARLRDLRPNNLDWENVAEEVESLGRSDKYEIEGNLAVVVMHLLKLKYRPEAAKSGWRSSVVEHRRRVARILRHSPSLRTYPRSVLDEEYAVARERAAIETRLPLETFPEACPFSIEQVLDPNFWPEAPAG